jgi:hypothetical protein
MAEENKDRLGMWSILSDSGDDWEYEPNPEVLAANAYFQALMGVVNRMVDIKTEMAITEEEKQDMISDLKRNMASLVWVTPMYDSFLKNPITGSSSEG